MKKGIALAFALLSSSVFADPTIFGMELGKMTEQGIKTMYHVKQTGINKHSGGNMYLVPVEEISFKGLTEVTAIFNKQGYLVAVLNKLPKRNFDSLYDSFGKSYRLISKENPFVGNKFAKYKDDGTEITIRSQQDNLYMSLDYIKNDLVAAFNNQDKTDVSVE